MTEGSGSGFWAAFGKFSAVVMLGMGVAQFGYFTYDRASTPKSDLKTHLALNDFALPPGASGPTSTSGKPFSRMAVMTIANDGTIAAKGVKVRVPKEYEVATVWAEDGTTQHYSSPLMLSLGDIAPQQHATIRLWSALPLTEGEEEHLIERLTVSHEAGMSSITTASQIMKLDALKSSVRQSVYGAIMSIAAAILLHLYLRARARSQQRAMQDHLGGVWRRSERKR